MAGRRSWGVLGAGLIGGSIAADLLAVGEPVVAYDPNERAAAALERRGAEIARGIDEVARRSEIVICAVPGPRAGAAVLSVLDASSECLVLDTAAPKGRIVRRLRESPHESSLAKRVFPAYPCVGQSLSGWRQARAGLLRGQTIAFCLQEEWELDAGALERVFGLAEIAGARGVFARPAELDRALARYAQLGRLLASREAELVLSDPLEGLLSDRGFADLTALAARDGDADAEAACANREALAEELEELAQAAHALAQLVRRGDRNGLAESLRRGQFARARLKAVRWGEREPHAIELEANARELLSARGPARSLRLCGEGRLRMVVG